jgi:peptidyl-prolyl cis-trans isomerase SurA
MKQLLFFLAFVYLFYACAVQKWSVNKESPLLIINVDTTVADEFIYVYEKNNFNNDSLYYESDVDAYFSLFVNFKLKVEAARAAGIDTTKAFIEEFNTYKDQLIKPYLSETKEQERLVEEAYDRMKYEVDASHILISVEANADPEDTAVAYNKIEDVYKKARGGEDFGDLAAEYSEDPSAKNNNGRLGYFTAFQMVYPFEEAAYNTEVESISDILRSRFGYHILKVHDKRPYSGKVKVSHIMLTNQNGTVDENILRNKIYEIHDQIVGGADWNELCEKYSEDQRTKNSGGTLPFIGLRQINDEAFETAAFNLQNPGDITDPVKSRFGWHIIKLEEKQRLPPFEEMKDELAQRVSRDERSRLSQQAVVKKLKEQHRFDINEVGRELLLSLADSSLFRGNWHPQLPDTAEAETVFAIQNDSYILSDVVEGIETLQRNRTGLNPKEYLDELLDKYIEQELLSFEEKQLISDNRDFRMLLNEYYEGILLFEIMNEKVWGRAVEDTLGLRAYFTNHQDDYYWDTRVAATIFEAGEKSTIESVEKDIERMSQLLMEIKIANDGELRGNTMLDSLVSIYKQYPLCEIKITGDSAVANLKHYFRNMGIPDSSIVFISKNPSNNISIQLNSRSKKSLEYLYNKESALTLSVEEGRYEKGDNQLVDGLDWQKGIYHIENAGNHYLILIEEVLKPQSKMLNEIKGTVISDYQNYLEKSWIKELKDKFDVQINNRTLEQIKTAFKYKIADSH